jgi:hypothetical protein
MLICHLSASRSVECRLEAVCNGNDAWRNSEVEMRSLMLFAVLIPLVALAVDQKISLRNHLLKCLLDNFAHGLLALLIWTPNAGVGSSLFTCGYFRHFEILRRHSPLLELLLSFIFGCVLDIDHFIAGGALTLQAATTLSSRPFGHSLLFISFSSV